MVEERSDDMVATMHQSSSELESNEDGPTDQNPSSDRQKGSSSQRQINISPGESSPINKIASLLQFASTGKVEDVKKILDEGLDVNLPDYDKRTALHLAASEGNYDVVSLLLERKANVNPIDRWNDTPLQDAMTHMKGNEKKKEEYQKVHDLLAANGGQGRKNEQAELEHAEQLGQLQEEYEIEVGELNLDGAVLIGQGSYGQVKLVNWRGTNVAAKMILQRLAKREEIKKEFRMELFLLQSLRHPNIVEFLGAMTKTDTPVIVTEYLPNIHSISVKSYHQKYGERTWQELSIPWDVQGDLHEIIRRRGRIQAKDAVNYALDIARGMNYLHQHKPKAIVHRDLKPRNLLQDAAGHLKVADFGLSKLLEPRPRSTDAYNMTGETGTYRYMAPEVFLHRTYDKSVDVFSFGIIVQEMFEGGQFRLSSPGHEVAHDRAQSNKRQAFIARTYPPGMKELLQQCWAQDPALRPPFESIIGKLEKMRDELKATSRWKGAVNNISSTWSRFAHHSRLKEPPMSNRGGSRRGECAEDVQHSRLKEPAEPISNSGGSRSGGGSGSNWSEGDDGSVSGSVRKSYPPPQPTNRTPLHKGSTSMASPQG